MSMTGTLVVPTAYSRDKGHPAVSMTGTLVVPTAYSRDKATHSSLLGFSRLQINGEIPM